MFNNTGVFRKLGAGLLTIPAAAEFRHLRSLEVNTGTMSFAAGGHLFSDGASISGDGQCQVDGATINLTGTVQLACPFTLASGLLTGVGSLNGNWTWSGGAIGGTLTHPTGRQLLITGTATKTLNKDTTLVNVGLVAVEDKGPLQFLENTTFNNQGFLVWRGSGSFSTDGHGNPVLINSGTFRKTVATATLAFNVIQLQNSGVLDVQAGVISFPANTHWLNNGSRISGSAITRFAGATMNLGGTLTFETPVEFTAGTLQGTATINGNLAMSGGTIPSGSSSGAFTLNGNLGWSGGTLYGSLTENGTADWSDGTLYGSLLIAPAAQLNIRNGGNPTLSGTLTNAGQATTVGNASLTVLDKSLFVNNGLLEVQFEKPFAMSGNGNATVINAGTLRRTISTRAMDFSSVLLQNSGTLDLESGDLTFSANSHGFANGARTMGAGTVRVLGGTLTLAGTSTMDAPFELAGGELTGTATINANGGMTWSGGIIPNGSEGGVFTVNGNVTWSGGELEGSLTENGILNWSDGLLDGTLTIPAASRANVLPPGRGSISGVLQNAGTMVISNNASILLLGGTPIVNSGVLELQNEQALKPNGTTKVTVLNSGTLRKTISTKSMKLEYVLLQNSGTLDVQAGEISLALNTHNFTDGTRLTGPGAVRVNGATLEVAGNLTFDAPFELAAGTIEGSATITGNLTCSGGTIEDPLRVNGPFTWTGGLVKNGLTADGAANWSGGQLEGTFTTTTNGTLTVSGNATKLLKGTLNNNGSVTLAAPGGLQNNGGTIQNYGVFNLLGDSTIVTVGGGRPVLNNYAVLNLTNGFARFNLGGDFQQFPAGMLNLAIDGTNVGNSLNQLVGLNKTTLAGALNVLLTTNYAPALGDRLEIVKCTDRIGTFGTYAANTPRLTPDYSVTNVTLFAAAPTITRQPQSKTVGAGSTATFSVDTYGSLPMSYQWWWNDAPLARATNAALSLTNVTPALETNYLVVVTNIWGGVTSAPVTLSVIIPPAITQQPASLTVNQGDPAVFQVQATGTHLSYRWRFGDHWLSGTDTPVLALTNVTAAQSGKYKVEISNVGGTITSTEVILTVIVPPTITEHPQSKNVDAGSSVTLTVKANGTEPFQYFWTRDGVAIPANGASLELRNVQAAQVGAYAVVVANAAGFDESQPAFIALNAPPQITAQPVSQSLAVGSNVVFSVAATGVPAPTYQWRKNGVNISGATSPTLALPNVKPGDSGSYSVVVANHFGAVESAHAELEVLVPKLAFADNFADRGYIYTASGYGSGTNAGATFESEEPKHAGKKSATTSVWISWWAPANGIVTFSTAGSDFDTVLAVYRGSAVAGLTKVAADDDSAGYHCSSVSFNAKAGTYYEIAVAGVGGESGDIVLGWDLVVTSELLPEIVQAPLDQTANTNATVALEVVFNAFEPTAIQWFFQGQPIEGATQSILSIPDLQVVKVGGYAVRLTAASGRTVVSAPGDVQINTAGLTMVGARNKLTDALDSALLFDAPSGFVDHSKTASKPSNFTTPSRGYTGSQVFSTLGADKDEDEPNHCGVPGGASRWFVYQAAITAPVLFDTEGSSFDTVLAVYTGSGASYDSLTPVACDDNSGADGFTSRVVFDAEAGTLYYIAVDGVDGASGTVVLNYGYVLPPVLTEEPVCQSVAVGSSLTLSANATGAPAPEYQWSFNGIDIPGATSASVVIDDFQPDWQGKYQVRVQNVSGFITSNPVDVYAAGALRVAQCKMMAHGWFRLRVVGAVNGTYTLQRSSDLKNWTPLATNTLPTGVWDFDDFPPSNVPHRYYRVMQVP